MINKKRKKEMKNSTKTILVLLVGLSVLTVFVLLKDSMFLAMGIPIGLDVLISLPIAFVIGIITAKAIIKVNS